MLFKLILFIYFQNLQNKIISQNSMQLRKKIVKKNIKARIHFTIYHFQKFEKSFAKIVKTSLVKICNIFLKPTKDNFQLQPL